jgi:hypothetical protein
MLLEEIKPHNFVAKHSQSMSGAGQHVDKKGKKAPRHKQKQQFRKQLQKGDY